MLDELHHLLVERVHLRGEFQAGDTVAHVPQRGGAVGNERLGTDLDVFQQQHAVGARDVGIVAGRREILPPSCLDAIEGKLARRLQQRRHRPAFGPEPLGQRPRPEAVDHLERTIFPIVAELHRIIDGDNGIRRLADQRCRVGKDQPQHRPRIGSDLARGRNQGGKITVRAQR